MLFWRDFETLKGETQQILDQLSDEVMTKRLLHSGAVSMIVSEEDENVIYPVRAHFLFEMALGVYPAMELNFESPKIES